MPIETDPITTLFDIPKVPEGPDPRILEVERRLGALEARLGVSDSDPITISLSPESVRELADSIAKRFEIEPRPTYPQVPASPWTPYQPAYPWWPQVWCQTTATGEGTQVWNGDGTQN